jgi:hypothetical protein
LFEKILDYGNRMWGRRVNAIDFIVIEYQGIVKPR